MNHQPSEGIITGAVPSTLNGKTQNRAIELSTGEQLFLHDIGNQTVNIGEFLGVVEAVKYIIENDFYLKVIYTDSKTAITWFQAKATALKENYPGLKKSETFLKAMVVEVKKIKFLH